MKPVLLGALALFASGAAAQPFSIDEPWKSATTAELAAKFLPPDLAREVVMHKTAPPLFAGQPPFSITFYARPRPFGDGICERTYYYVNPSDPHFHPGSEIRLGACPRMPDPMFARIQPNTAPVKAKQALLWLDWARRTARGRKPLPFDLECKSDVKPDPCLDGARNALARLPLEMTLFLGKPLLPYPADWEFAVEQTEALSPFWHVLLRTDSSGKSHVSLSWEVPPPF
jgi:hypothetical protein